MIRLDYRDGRPIYEQIKDGVKRLILSGALPAGERLPSIREMAGTLSINPNTIAHAYRDLEAEGFIVTITGKGTFAAGGDAADIHRKDLLIKFDEVTGELIVCGVSKEELKRRIDEHD